MVINVSNGHSFERLVFGDMVSDIDPAFPPRFERYLSAIQSVKERQSFINWKAHKPSTQHAKELFQAVAIHLPDKWMPNELRLFVSVGTALDFYYHIDCFFGLGQVIATLDLTLRDTKRPRRFVDFLLTKRHFEEDRLPEIGYKIAKRLLDRRSRAIERRKNQRPLRGIV